MLTPLHRTTDHSSIRLGHPLSTRSDDFSRPTPAQKSDENFENITSRFVEDSFFILCSRRECVRRHSQKRFSESLIPHEERDEKCDGGIEDLRIRVSMVREERRDDSLDLQHLLQLS